MTAAHSAAIESAPHAWNFYGIARENSTLGQTDYRRTGDPPSAIRPTYIGVVVRLPIGISPNAPDETRGGLEGAFCCARGRNQNSLQPSPPYRLLLRSLHAAMSGRSDSRAFLGALRNQHAQRFSVLCARSESCLQRLCSANDSSCMCALFFRLKTPTFDIVRPTAVTSPLNVVQHANTSPL